MCCRRLTSSRFLGWDSVMCVEPVRSAFGAGARRRAPQQQWISSHIAHIAEAPRKWKLMHSPHSAQPQDYMDNGIWRTNKINQYHLSLEYFGGLWKGQSAYFSSCFLVQEAFTAAVTVHEERGDPKPTDNVQSWIYRLLLPFYVRAARFQPTKTNRTELRRDIWPSYTRSHLHTDAFYRDKRGFHQ